MSRKAFFTFLAVIILAIAPLAAKAETICFHCVGYVQNGVKHSIPNKESYKYITFENDRAYESDADGFHTVGNVMYFMERDGSILTYVDGLFIMGGFTPGLTKLLYDTDSGRMNQTICGMTYIYDRVQAPTKSKPQMY